MVVPKSSTLDLAWQYIQNESDHHRFTNMLCVSPIVFQVLLDLIQEHPIFCNHSNNPQTPDQTQLAVTLYHMGCYGNGASLEDIARIAIAGISEGSLCSATLRAHISVLLSSNNHIWTWLSGTMRGRER